MTADELDCLFPEHRSRESYVEGPRFRELHLYHGSLCNRTCSFCAVHGSPAGWTLPFDASILDAALRWTAPDGNLKLYGGEPTLDLANLVWTVRYLRDGGFTGWLTLFTNGVLAARVIRFLESDPCTEAVLNFSILVGRGADPLPGRALALLAGYAREHPGRLFRSHADLVPVGGGLIELDGRERSKAECPRCHPVLTSAGQLHACPFAVEYRLPHYNLAEVDASADQAVSTYRAFRAWVGNELEPAASACGESVCRTCIAWSER
jgi:hypothetical protein